jgi:hypothetical protein
MSQYVVIFLIVAVFRGVIWVVQKVQQNAKAREALMAQQGSAQAAAPAPARAPRPPQRGQVRRVDRTAGNRVRGGLGARTEGRAAVAKSGQPVGPSAGGSSAAPAQARPDPGSREAAIARQAIPSGAPASRAFIREARVGRSSQDVRNLLLERSSLRQVLLAREILGPPRGMTA